MYISNLIALCPLQVAWSVSVELLSVSGALESASPLQYFSANTLYTKVRKHWHQLEAEHRDQLGAVILQVCVRGKNAAYCLLVLHTAVV